MVRKLHCCYLEKQKHLFGIVSVAFNSMKHGALVPGHALHEDGLQKQGVGPLVSSQEGTKSASRPVDKPLVNRLSIGRCVPPSDYIGFPLFVLLDIRR